MKEIASALKNPTFRWLPKHLNHIAVRIAIDKNDNIIVITAYSESDEE